MNRLPLNFKIIWFGQLMSTIGMGLTIFALGVHAFKQTGLVADFAMITICSFVPTFILSPFGGVAADRFNRASMMVLADIGNAFGIVIVIMSILSDANIGWLYAGLLFCSICNGFKTPAYKALLTDLLDKNLYAKASGLVQLGASSQYLISPFIAGLLMAYSDIRAVLIINLLIYIIAAVCTFSVEKTILCLGITENKNIISDLKEGWNILINNKNVLILSLIISVLVLFMGYLQVLMGPMVLSFATSAALGMAQSVGAVGALIAGIYIGIKGIKNERTALIAGMFVTGISLVFMGFRPNIYIVMSAMFVFFCALPFMNASTDVIIRTGVDNAYQGRVWGMIGLISQIGNIIAYTTAGFIADKLFNPLLANSDSILAPMMGMVTGIGDGRGIGLFLIICGVLTFCLAVVGRDALSTPRL